VGGKGYPLDWSVLSAGARASSSSVTWRVNGEKPRLQQLCKRMEHVALILFFDCWCGEHQMVCLNQGSGESAKGQTVYFESDYSASDTCFIISYTKEKTNNKIKIPHIIWFVQKTILLFGSQRQPVTDLGRQA